MLEYFDTFSEFVFGVPQGIWNMPKLYRINYCFNFVNQYCAFILTFHLNNPPTVLDYLLSFVKRKFRR